MAQTEHIGAYLLTIPDGVFPLGGDALALGAFATVRPGWSVCDLGTGSGLLLFLLSARQSGLTLCGVELDTASAQAARDNLQQNNLAGDILTGDLRQQPFPSGTFDLVVANPPYFPIHAGKSGGPARSEAFCTLDELCAAAARLVKNGGRFAVCHRPERLVDLMCALRAAGLEPKRLKLLSHSPQHPPFAVLVESVRQGGPGLEIVL